MSTPFETTITSSYGSAGISYDFRSSELTDPLTGQENQKRKNMPKQGSQLVAHDRNDITIPFYTDVLQPQDITLATKGQGKGFKLYDQVEGDGHCYAVLQKRALELVGREWTVEPVSDEPADVEVADFCQEVFGKLAFDQLTLDLLDATLRGFAVVEVIWKRDENRIVPKGFVSIAQDRIRFDEDWKPRLLTHANMQKGEQLPDRKFIVHRFGSSRDPYGLGLGTRLFWHVAFKRETVAFWMVFLEKYASPTPFAETPMLLPAQERKLLDGLVNMTQAGALIAPLGTKVSLLEATRSAPAGYESSARYWDEKSSEVVTLSTNIGSVGSQAAAQTHAEQKSQVVDADGDLLSDTLYETLMRWIVELNFPGRAVPRTHRQRPENAKSEAEARETEARAEEAEMTVLEKAIDMTNGLDEAQAMATVRIACESSRKYPDDGLRRLITARRAAASTEPAVIDSTNARNGDAVPEDGDDESKDSDPAFAAPPEEVFNTPVLSDEVASSVAPQIQAALDNWLAELDPETLSEETLRDLASPNVTLTAAFERALLLTTMIGRVSVVLEAEEDGLSRADLFPDAPIDLANGDGNIVFEGVPYEQAMTYLRNKAPMPTEDYDALLKLSHDRAFAVTGETQEEVLEDIREALLKSVENGTGREGFRTSFRELLANGKWSDDDRLVDDAKLFGWRTDIIWQTNLSNAHAAGRRQQQLDLIDVLPFWQYRHAATRTPQSPRIRHVKLDGLTLPATDVVWARIYAPNGWRCSCAIRAITAAAAGRVDENKRQRPTESEIGEAVDHEWQHAPGLDLDADQ